MNVHFSPQQYATMLNPLTTQNATAAAKGDLDLSCLTPEELIGYLQSQLSGLDGQIKEMMHKQDSMKNELSALSTLKQTLGNRTQSIDKGAKEQKAEILNAYKTALDALPDGPERDRVLANLDEFRRTACFEDGDIPARTSKAYTAADIDADLSRAGDDRNGVSADEMNNKLAHGIDDIITDVNQGSELAMIKLQSLVGQRQQAVTMVTNMLQKMNEGVMAAIANLK